MLEGYAAGNLVSSDFMGCERLRKKLRLNNADPSGILAEVFSQIEKAMVRPADPCRTRLAASPFLLHRPSASR